MTVFPLLVRQMAKDAPNASIELNPLSGDFLEQLRAGRADIAVYPLDTVPKDFHRLELIKAAAHSCSARSPAHQEIRKGRKN